MDVSLVDIILGSLLAWFLDGIPIPPRRRWLALKLAITTAALIIVIRTPSLSQNYSLYILIITVSLISIFISSILRLLGTFSRFSNRLSSLLSGNWLRASARTSWILSLPIIIVISVLVYPFVDGLIVSHQCNQRLVRNDGKVQQIINACTSIINEEGNSNKVLPLGNEGKTLSRAHTNRGRASLVGWYRAGRTEPIESVEERVSQDFADAYEKYSLDPLRLANFYKLYMREFKALVIENKDLPSESKNNCQIAYENEENPAGLYKPVIDAYTSQGIPYASLSNISIYIELAHFLVNRDGNYDLAEKFYRKIPKNDPTRPDVLMGLGNVYFLKGSKIGGIDDFLKSKDYYEEAFKKVEGNDVIRVNLYDLTYNLGALEARLAGARGASYGNAINYLSKAYTDFYDSEEHDEHPDKVFYKARRDLAFAYLLDGNYEASVTEFSELTSSDEYASRRPDDLVNEYFRRAQECEQSSSSCDIVDADKRRLLRAGIFTNFIVHDAIDPFFDVEHDSFYSCLSNSSEDSDESNLSNS